ncbi:MAG: ribonuclease H family protein [Pseudomonadales bacterium]|nr:ribonuclease H family protein [Pseudomonadales bacterium]
MAKKYYVVWSGRETGVFNDWSTCKKSIDKFSGARYKSFPSLVEAEAAFARGGPGGGAVNSNKKPSKSITDASSLGKYEVEIYCDGGCDPNPGKAGSGSAVYREGKLAELWYGLFNSHGTNNTAELNALHQSLLVAENAIKAKKTVAIYCDSQYSINCASVWAYDWKKNDWKKKGAKKGGGEIKNLDLIKEIHGLYDRIQDDLQLLHVKAHVGIEGNEPADRMTMIAVDRQELSYTQYTDGLDIGALLNMRSG